MSKKKSKRFVDWVAEQQATQEPEKPMTAGQIAEAFEKKKKAIGSPTRPLIKSSHS